MVVVGVSIVCIHVVAIVAATSSSLLLFYLVAFCVLPVYTQEGFNQMQFPMHLIHSFSSNNESYLLLNLAYYYYYYY